MSLLAFNGHARVLAAIPTIFAVIAYLLAMVGLYGVESFAVSQRTKEFGVRMDLGADRLRIIGLVVRRGGVQLLVGVTAGVVLALVFVQVAGARLEGFLYQVNPRDSGVYANVVSLLAFSAFLACIVPARRAARVNPIVALRSE